jgi:hypothetical protein
MKVCDACNVTVIAPRTRCPLCSAALTAREGDDGREVYPLLPTSYNKYERFFRVLMFVSVAACVICVGVNLFKPQGGWWSLIVVAGSLYMWIGLIYGVRRLHRLGRAILYQLVALAVVTVLIDHLYGQYGWAIDYVVPALCVAGMLSLSVVAAISPVGLEEYAIYVVVNALLGLAPLLFILLGLTDVTWPSIACLFVSLLSLVGVVIVGGKDMLQELKRRFHV